MLFEDEFKLHKLGIRYATAVDACDVTLFQSVFTETGRLRAFHPGAEESFTHMVGHEQLARVPNAMRGQYRHTTHMMTNHVVEVDGDRASGTVLCAARHLNPDATETLNVYIRYVDRYERHGDDWKIADREIRFLWSERHAVCDSGY